MSEVLSPNEDALRPLSNYFPSKSLRWISDACRAGRIPGAVKVGSVWMISGPRWREYLDRNAKRAPISVEDAAADLRKRGVL